MKAIWIMTWRQLRRSRLRTALTFCSVFLSTVLLCAALVGGASLEACLQVRQDSRLGILVRAASVFVAAVLLICTAVLIRQSFALSLAGRVRALGQLASVGATRRQLMGSVYLEAALFGAAAIPAGILCALAGLGLTFALLNAHPGVARSLTVPLKLCVSPATLRNCAGWAALDLLLAARKPARAARRILPLQAVRRPQPTGRLRPGRQLAVPGRMPQKLAALSLQRGGTRGWAAALGLAVCTLLLIAALAFSGMVRDAYAAETAEEGFLYRMYFWSEKGVYPAEALAAVETAMAGQEHLTAELFDTVHFEVGPPAWDTFTQLVVLPNDAFAAWYGSPLAPRPDRPGALPCVLCTGISSPEAAGPEAESLFGPLSIAGSRIEPVWQAPCAAPLPLGCGQNRARPGQNGRRVIVTSRAAFDAALLSLPETQDRSFAVYCAPEDGSAVTRLLTPVLQNAGIQRYMDQDYTPTSWTVLRQTFVRVVLRVFTLGFAALVFLVCAASVFAMVSASLLLRSREFALLQSVGLTDAGLFALLRSECLRLGAAGLAVGLPLGALAAWQIARLLGLELGSALRIRFFALPALCVAAIIAGCLLLCRHALARQTIVEGLRQKGENY